MALGKMFKKQSDAIRKAKTSSFPEPPIGGPSRLLCVISDWQERPPAVGKNEPGYERLAIQGVPYNWSLVGFSDKGAIKTLGHYHGSIRHVMGMIVRSHKGMGIVDPLPAVVAIIAGVERLTGESFDHPTDVDDVDAIGRKIDDAAGTSFFADTSGSGVLKRVFGSANAVDSDDADVEVPAEKEE